jgi:outer membrane protein assembly factor BamE (lipoprotein component of BamABCDE complex)
MKKLLLSVTIAATALLSGCYSQGHDFDSSKASQIQKGVTTEAELVHLFGAPTSRGLDENGMTMLTWSYTHADMATAYGLSEVKMKGLMVFLDKDGKVVKFSSNGN